ncbi:hypothetical protein B0H16DRAFT_1535428 [Mycena metata]|uniref:Uncharacterized protein n=1 Tax=Mycena metata TaxID=1033252 RepID=A0AAD7MQN7_9AGAR|nr:hypothetical protein B0H16DRAFT_1590041 [Mycena metata]KAJ7758727.1 hypothetical protein B0H16DRAFT_1535428 [Mycena metata]
MSLSRLYGVYLWGLICVADLIIMSLSIASSVKHHDRDGHPHVDISGLVLTIVGFGFCAVLSALMGWRHWRTNRTPVLPAALPAVTLATLAPAPMLASR